MPVQHPSNSAFISVRSDGTTYSGSSRDSGGSSGESSEEDYGSEFDGEDETILSALLERASARLSPAPSSARAPASAGSSTADASSASRHRAAGTDTAHAALASAARTAASGVSGIPAATLQAASTAAPQPRRWSQRLAYRAHDVEISSSAQPRRNKRDLPHNEQHNDAIDTDAYRSRGVDAASHGIGYSDGRAQPQAQPRVREPVTSSEPSIRGDAPGTLSPPPAELPPEALADSQQRALEVTGSRRAGNATAATAAAALASARDALAPDAPASNSRSPLQRFRPRGRPLSVTDLVSPAWCEMQWAFTLARHGRKRATPAMTSGTRIHQRLEAEVHTTVQMDVQSREDAFGLRIWNIIHGLQTLRTQGRTRELEVWGVFDGQLVNGIIDELSYVCPDKDLDPLLATEDKKKEKRAKTENVPQGQARMTDFFAAGAEVGADRSSDSTPGNLDASTSSQASRSTRKTASSPFPAPAPQTSGQRLRRLDSMRVKTSRIYICDVKTRAAPSMPQGASFRPTFLQLMLYRQLLEQMIEGSVSIITICRTLRLDPDTEFSDAFLVQIIGLHEDFDAETPPSSFNTSQDTVSEPQDDTADMLDELLAHNSLRDLWKLLRAELDRVFPAGAQSLGDVLKVEYRSPEQGEIRGIKTFLFNRELIQEYISTVLQWWTGEREPAGVIVEEAYKCRSCDFAADCTWRLDKEAEARDQYRARNREGG